MRWSIDPILLKFGFLELRWYGLFFATGLLLSAWRAPVYFQKWGLPKHHAERLSLWVPIGMLLGAHYIHLAFYEQDGLFDFRLFDAQGHFHPGRFWALGSGLASHGGALGCVVSLWLFWHRNGRPLGIRFHRYADALMVTSIWVYPFVRLGNFFNSEIVGRETDVPWGVIFVDRGYMTPRHPVQLYEAALYFIELAIAALYWNPKFARKLRPGTTFYFFLMLHFSFRFIAEFAKEYQEVDVGWALNMGHLLSLPIILVCAFQLFATRRFNLLTPLKEEEVREIEESAERSRAYDEQRDIELGQQKSGAPAAPISTDPAVAAAKRKAARKKGR